MSQQFRVATDGPEKQTRHEHKKVRRHWNLQPEHPELSSTTHQAARQGSASGGLGSEIESKTSSGTAWPGLGLHCLDHEVGGVRRTSDLQLGLLLNPLALPQSLPRCEEDNQRRRDHPRLKGQSLRRANPLSQ